MSGRIASELAKFTGTETKLLFERLTKGRMGMVTSGKRNLRNVHCTHPKFSSRAFHAHTTDIVGYVLAYLGCEDAMKVGHGETSDCRQQFPIEWFVDVLADVLLDSINAFAIVLRTLRHDPSVDYCSARRPTADVSRLALENQRRLLTTPLPRESP